MLIRSWKCQVFHFELYLWAIDKWNEMFTSSIIQNDETLYSTFAHNRRFPELAWNVRILNFFRACIRFSVVREFFFTQSSFNLRKMGKCHYQRAMYLSHLHIKLNSIKRKTDNPTIVISIYWFDCGCNRQYRQKPAINNATKKKEDKHNCLLAKQHYPFRISCQRT